MTKKTDNKRQYTFSGIEQRMKEVRAHMSKSKLSKVSKDTLLDACKKQYKNQLIGLSRFEHTYISEDKAEILKIFLKETLQQAEDKTVYVFEGEDKLFFEVAKSLDIAVKVLQFDEDTSMVKDGIFYISNPSTIHGNIILNEKILEIGDAGHRIIMDASFIGLVLPFRIYIDHPNVLGMIMDVGTSFGIQDNPLQIVFTKNACNELERLSKDIQSATLFTYEYLFEVYENIDMYKLYGHMQSVGLSNFEKQYGVKLHRSHVFYYGYVCEKDLTSVQCKKHGKSKRGKYYLIDLREYM